MKMIFDQVAQFLQKGVNMITREGKLVIVPSQKGASMQNGWLFFTLYGFSGWKYENDN